MNHIRIATEEEVESIRKGSDLGPAYTVLAMDRREGKPHLAVLKNTVELDPVYFAPDATTAQRARFIWGLEERLIGAGVRQYFFNVSIDDKEWQQNLRSWGAVQQSPGPELRFGRELIGGNN